MLAPRTRLGPYEIESAIGQGGMGGVYRARDTRLDRTVAIKVLLAELADDARARERFEREARAISHINHPHICTLYDVGEDRGVSYLVMELLDGETLAARLGRGALPVEQAIAFAAQIADALDKAHRAGVVHGDLKPGNIMLTRTGVKLLDFGLATQRSAPASASSDAAATTTTTVSRPGEIVGTLQYLAPEQLEGKEPDPRTDIFAFGAVLYEMITGKRAFDGHTPAAVIAAIMQHDPPPIATLRRGTPSALDHIVTTCLAKDPDARWQHAGDLTRELRWVGESAAAPPAAPAPARVSRSRAWMAVAAVLLVALVALAAWMVLNRRTPDAFPVRTSILLPEGLRFPAVGGIGGVSRFAISPDGHRLAFVATDTAGNLTLWVRPLDSLRAMPVAGTDGASSPFWSPDSRTIAFVAQGQLKTVDPDGGAPVVIASPASNTTGAWGRGDVILFTPTLTSPIFRVGAAGGTPQPVTTLDRKAGDVLHRNPSILPDGKHFLFVAAGQRGSTGTVGPRAVYVGSLDRSEPSKLLIDNGTNVRYGQGHVIFVRENMLMAQPFDLGRLALTGEPKPVAEQVELIGPGSAAFTVSDSGMLAYEPSSDGSELVWFDREGRQLSAVGDRAGYGDLEISPDGKRAAVSVLDPATNTRDLWIVDLERGVRSRFTFDPADDVEPIWSADGSRIVFASNRKGHFDLYEKTTTGLDGDRLLYADDTEKFPNNWLRDGRLLIWSIARQTTATSLSVLTPGPTPAVAPFLGPPTSQGALSPDGRWVAYSSAESGRPEVYVVPFPMASRKWQVSNAGGTLPRWRSDGRELYYAGRDNRLMAVDVEAAARELQIGTPHALFEARPVGVRSFYDVTHDGQRFLVNSVHGESALPSITVVQDWTSALKP